MKKGQRVMTPDGPGVYVKAVSKTVDGGLVMVQLDDAPEIGGSPVCDVFHVSQVESVEDVKD